MLARRAKLAAVVVAAVGAIALAGCMSREEAGDQAAEFCAKHGGVEDFVYLNGPDQAEVECRDGAFKVFGEKGIFEPARAAEHEVTRCNLIYFTDGVTKRCTTSPGEHDGWRDQYRRTWRKADAALGFTSQQGRPMPRVEPIGGERSYVSGGRRGYRTVYLGRDERHDLKAGGELRDRARGILLHEWAHVYQSSHMLRCIDGREGGADLFAAHWSRKLYGWDYGEGYPPSYDRAFERCAGPDRRDYLRRQFGENWGENPRTIMYG